MVIRRQKAAAANKAIISYTVGKRIAENTRAFAADMYNRIINQPQITTDGLEQYVPAIEEAFGIGVDYAMLVKRYEGEPGPDAARRYSPGWVVGVTRQRVIGQPRREHISTSFVERQNLSLRMASRRFTRLTNGFSKKLANHEAAVSLTWRITTCAASTKPRGSRRRWRWASPTISGPLASWSRRQQMGRFRSRQGDPLDPSA